MPLDIIALVSITISGAVSLIHAIQASKCDTIDLCCFKLHRVVNKKPIEEEDGVEARPVLNQLN